MQRYFKNPLIEANDCVKIKKKRKLRFLPTRSVRRTSAFPIPRLRLDGNAVREC